MAGLGGPEGESRKDEERSGDEAYTTLRIRMAKMPADPQAFVEELAQLMGVEPSELNDTIFIQYTRNEDGSDPTEPGSDPGKIEDIRILPRRPDVSETP